MDRRQRAVTGGDGTSRPFSLVRVLARFGHARWCDASLFGLACVWRSCKRWERGDDEPIEDQDKPHV